MENFLISLNAIVPFLIYLALGNFARRCGIMDEAFANHLNRVAFKLFFPCVTFYNIYNASWDTMPSTRLLVLVVGGILLQIVLLCFITPHFVPDHRRTGVVVQAIYRSNMLLYGLPLTLNLFGQGAAALASVVVTLIVAIYNVAAVIVLEMFSSESRTSFRQLLKGVCKNPLLQGAALGFVLFVLKIRLPSSVLSAVSSISGMTTPLALFALGATLRVSALRKNIRCIAVSLVIKMLLIPAGMLVVGLAAGLQGLELFLLIMTFATPIATASYPMAQNMGGDGELAGQFVVLSTIVSLPSLFCWIYFLKSMALL